MSDDFIKPATDAKVADFVKLKHPGTPWLIEPYLPLGGIVFLHGPTSAGKSPLTWKLAMCVSGGEDFFGYKVQTKGAVLYVELDTPASLIQPRLAKLDNIPSDFNISTFPKPLNTINLDVEDSIRLKLLQVQIKPKLVIVNTLRKAHTTDDKESGIPSQIYGKWLELFPGATILFVHHDKKQQLEDQNPDQSFSGSQAWANDAQVALKLTRLGNVEHNDEDEYRKTKVSLRMTKSQVSDCELYPALILQLDQDGTNWLETGPEAYRKYFISLDLKLDRPERIQQTMNRFGMGKTAIYNAVKGLE